MKSLSIFTVLALLCASTVNAIGHPDHEMAYYLTHPGKMPNSQVQRDIPYEPVSEEQAIEAAMLGQESFLQI